MAQSRRRGGRGDRGRARRAIGSTAASAFALAAALRSCLVGAAAYSRRLIRRKPRSGAEIASRLSAVSLRSLRSPRFPRRSCLLRHRLRHPHVPHPPHVTGRRPYPHEQVKRYRVAAVRRPQRVRHDVAGDVAADADFESSPPRHVAHRAERERGDRARIFERWVRSGFPLRRGVKKSRSQKLTRFPSARLRTGRRATSCRGGRSPRPAAHGRHHGRSRCGRPRSSPR